LRRAARLPKGLHLVVALHGLESRLALGGGSDARQQRLPLLCGLGRRGSGRSGAGCCLLRQLCVVAQQRATLLNKLRGQGQGARWGVMPGILWY
jgi:hypothetical protein